MVGINLVVASHKLNIIPTARPVRQKVRRFHLERNQIIQTEVDNLLRASFIREVKFPEWLANVVVVPKKGGKWRVCVDYTDLNEACPKDSFSLPHINQIVGATVGHGILSFLDCDECSSPCTRLGVRTGSEARSSLLRISINSFSQ